MTEDLEQLAQEYKIVIRDLMKVYKRGSTEVIALRGVDFEVHEGEFLSIIGPSGSGKTTLLRMIGALDRPTAGLVLFEGHNITLLNDYHAMLYRRKKVGFVWQTGNLVPGLTAIKNVMLPMRLAGAPKRAAEKRAKMLLAAVGLELRLNHRPHQLSGGENQRVAICVALANKPELLLADEITGELDTETADVVMQMLKEMNEEFNTTVINVTHNPNVTKYADRVLRIRDGLIEGQRHVLFGDISEIDAKGRLVIPESVRRLANLGKRVVLSVTPEGLLIKPLDESATEVPQASEEGEEMANT
ncbi:MAG: ATP-binding cassette domain-containing protein [Candidatus Thorarchaeota archaeon]|nr:ATP-binding cassette domain-containing protein [Candidatus Thorarchaeota archaeon]